MFYPHSHRFWICALAIGASTGCTSETEEPPQRVIAPPASAVATSTPEATGAVPAQGNSATNTQVASTKAEEPQDAGVKDADSAAHSGPHLVVTALETGVYEEPKFDRKLKLGWVRNGGRVPIEPEPLKKDNCKGDWFRVVGGGYICGSSGTIDEDDTEAKLALKPPELDDILPYKYARNTKNGTPMYRSLPSREQMYQYEPYLPGAKKQATPKPEPEQEAGEQRSADSSIDNSEVADRVREHLRAELADAGIVLAEAAPEGEPEPEIPWWQREDVDDKLHEVTLEKLEEEADGILAKRMVKGFYVAVDRTFPWNGRTWYKTTKGLIAPADRMGQRAGSDFKGNELDGEEWTLPLGWVHGWKKRTTYSLDEETKQLKPADTLDRFSVVKLTGRSMVVSKRRYHELRNGHWIRTAHIRRTIPNAPPIEIQPGEPWLDVNLSQQTLVMFRGTRPVYATMLSSGKESRIKAKDHRTPIGKWRVREKHITTTMDGNGTAAGDLPYSIEDVPYVMYYHRSYAVHGAFWHENYGIQMSHGCVNLAPLDAKHVFFGTNPPLPDGLHGAWSRENRPGSLVVVHE